MTTIKISVPNKHDANWLYQMLKKIPFIESVEKAELLTDEKMPGQYEKIKNLMNSIAGSSLFKEIDNPETWQKDLRNEWE